MNRDDVTAMQAELLGKSPEEILAWAYQYFGASVTMASSFGLEDVVLIDASAAAAQAPVDVFFLDTGLLFSETHETVEAMVARYPMTLRTMTPLLTVGEQGEKHGEALWLRDPDACCAMRKVAPLNQALDGYQAWITGIRREQSPTRANAQAIEWDEGHQMVKINPLVMWSTEDVWDRVRSHEIPYNRLHDSGYPSIGCTPCTRQVNPGEDPRAGRWSGFDKKECGIHL